MLDEKYKNHKPPYKRYCTEKWALSQDSVPDYSQLYANSRLKPLSGWLFKAVFGRRDWFARLS